MAKFLNITTKGSLKLEKFYKFTILYRENNEIINKCVNISPTCFKKKSSNTMDT